MNYIIKTPNLITAEDHLKFDDHHLNSLTEKNSSIYLRFWELDDYCVVLGRSNDQKTEVYLEKATQNTISILKRSSGGGTVILGPGCLCYSLFIPTSFEPCNSIGKTNYYVMHELRKALTSYNSEVSVNGITDLCISKKKFSGNAQRRLKNTLLFHGTFLYNFDLSIISTLLQHPSKEPDYRNKRLHSEFITNIHLDKQTITNSVSTQFNCKELK